MTELGFSRRATDNLFEDMKTEVAGNSSHNQSTLQQLTARPCDEQQPAHCVESGCRGRSMEPPIRRTLPSRQRHAMSDVSLSPVAL